MSTQQADTPGMECWTDWSEWFEGVSFAEAERAQWTHEPELLESGICLLPEGHDGPHCFTPDSKIFLRAGTPLNQDGQ